MPEGLTRAELVAAARTWIGTPFHWGASVKGVGADCKGWISGMARELGLPEAASVEAHYSGYGRRADPAMLEAGMARLFDPVTEPEPGDVLLLNIAKKPQHLALYVGGGRMIHAYCNGPRQVIEVPMGTVWRSAIHSIWRWRDVG